MVYACGCGLRSFSRLPLKIRPLLSSHVFASFAPFATFTFTLAFPTFSFTVGAAATAAATAISRG